MSIVKTIRVVTDITLIAESKLEIQEAEGLLKQRIERILPSRKFALTNRLANSDREKHLRVVRTSVKIYP